MRACGELPPGGQVGQEGAVDPRRRACPSVRDDVEAGRRARLQGRHADGRDRRQRRDGRPDGDLGRRGSRSPARRPSRSASRRRGSRRPASAERDDLGSTPASGAGRRMDQPAWTSASVKPLRHAPAGVLVGAPDERRGPLGRVRRPARRRRSRAALRLSSVAPAVLGRVRCRPTRRASPSAPSSARRRPARARCPAPPCGGTPPTGPGAPSRGPARSLLALRDDLERLVELARRRSARRQCRRSDALLEAERVDRPEGIGAGRSALARPSSASTRSARRRRRPRWSVAAGAPPRGRRSAPALVRGAGTAATLAGRQRRRSARNSPTRTYRAAMARAAWRGCVRRPSVEAEPRADELRRARRRRPWPRSPRRGRRRPATRPGSRRCRTSW